MSDQLSMDEIRDLATSYSGLQYVVLEARQQWPWTSAYAVNEIIDLVRSVPSLLAQLEALLDQRDELEARVNELTCAFITHRTETHELKPTFCQTCRRSDAVLEGH